MLRIFKDIHANPHYAVALKTKGKVALGGGIRTVMPEVRVNKEDRGEEEVLGMCKDKERNQMRALPR